MREKDKERANVGHSPKGKSGERTLYHFNRPFTLLSSTIGQFIKRTPSTILRFSKT